MKLKTIYICQECNYETPKWLGKCPNCNAWNSFIEDVKAVGAGSETQLSPTPGLVKEPISILQAVSSKAYISTGIEEFDRVAGGGIMEGGFMLLSGEPGIGKSTLTLQLCQGFAAQNKTILYISGEESPEQIALRAKRIGIKTEKIQVLAETLLENILVTIDVRKPDLVIIDSVQVIASAQLPSIAGSINQVRLCAEQLMSRAKQYGIPIILIGHVTKEGSLAGPKVLEHLVDTVLLIEGDRFQNLRVVRSLKNRFGSTNEIGLFEMKEEGLSEVKNPSELFISHHPQPVTGSAITVTVEGSRVLLVEVQALTSLTPFGYPKRAASGFDPNRLNLLLAVIQKHLKYNVSNQDIYVNIAGGFHLQEPAADLAVVMAIISSLENKPLSLKAAFLGEVGLSGELRHISYLTKRINEAEKIGFEQLYVPTTKEKLKANKITIQQLKDLKEAVQEWKKG